MPATLHFTPLCKKPRRNYVHRRCFHSDFVFPSKPLPFVYYVDSRACRKFLGITRETQLDWVASWKATGFTSGVGPRPYPQGEGRYKIYKYLWDELMCSQPGSEWIDVFRRNRTAEIEADKAKARARSTGTPNNS